MAGARCPGCWCDASDARDERWVVRCGACGVLWRARPEHEVLHDAPRGWVGGLDPTLDAPAVRLTLAQAARLRALEPPAGVGLGPSRSERTTGYREPSAAPAMALRLPRPSDRDRRKVFTLVSMLLAPAAYVGLAQGLGVVLATGYGTLAAVVGASLALRAPMDGLELPPRGVDWSPALVIAAAGRVVTIEREQRVLFFWCAETDEQAAFVASALSASLVPDAEVAGRAHA